MKRKILALALMLAALPAAAQTASSFSASGAQAGSTAGAVGNVGNETIVIQDFSTPAKQTIEQRVSGGTTSTLNTDVNYSGDYKLKNVPNVAPPSIGVSAPCKGAFSVGGAVAGFGVAGGGSVNDEECQTRENARVLAQMGLASESIAVMCAIEAVAKAMPKRCQAVLAETGAVAPAPQPAAKKAQTAPVAPEIVSSRTDARVGGLVADSEGRLWKRVDAANGGFNWVLASH